MKASQSSTERAFSVASKIIENRFEKVYDYTQQKTDMVNIQVVLKLESNIEAIDSKLACQKILNRKYKAALMSEKLMYVKGSTLKSKFKPITTQKKRRKKIPYSDVKKPKFNIDDDNADEPIEYPSNQIERNYREDLNRQNKPCIISNITDFKDVDKPSKVIKKK